MSGYVPSIRRLFRRRLFFRANAFLVVSAGQIVPADADKREQHIDGIVYHSHVRIARVLADEYRQDGDPILTFAGDEEEFGVEGESTDRDLSEEVLGDGAVEEFEPALRIRELESAEDEDLQEVKSSGREDSVPW